MTTIRHALMTGAMAIAAQATLSAPAIARAAPDGARGQHSVTATTAEVNALIQSHINSFNARDAAKATSIDAPDFLGIFHGSANIVGPAQDLASTSAMVADPALKLVIENQHLDVSSAGDMATWRSTYRFTYTDPATGKPRVELGNYLIGFARQADGTMKAAWDVVSDTPPGP
ncbi:hypothetical protein BH09PSE4_BH09PSE4_04540 [soil metagenome]